MADNYEHNEKHASFKSSKVLNEKRLNLEPLIKRQSSLSKIVDSISNSNSSSQKNRRKKMGFIIGATSIAYQMPGSGEIKNKNYDNMINDIITVEKKLLIHNKKIKKKQSSKGPSSIQEVIDEYRDEEKYQSKHSNELKIENENIISITEIIKKIKIPPECRTIESIILIKTYLLQSKLKKSFLDEFNNVSIVDNLITFCSLEMRYQKYKEGEILFHIGDIPDKFYTILLGNVNIYKPVSKNVSITGFEYFSYLMKLRKNNDKYLFNLCIKENKTNYVISLYDAEIIHYIYLVNYLNIALSDSNESNESKQIDFEKIINFLDISPLELGLDPNKLNDFDYIYYRSFKIKKKIPPISDETIMEYIFITNKLVKNNVTIYEYDKYATMEKGDFFGENAIEKEEKRNCTAIAGCDTEVAYLSNKLYMMKIGSEKNAFLEKKVEFLQNNFFFKKISVRKFEKNYYCWFFLDTYTKGDILFQENQKLDYIYFIQEGNVQLYSNKSITENQILMKKIRNKLKELNNDYDMDPNINDYLLKSNDYSYGKIQCDGEDLIGFLNKKEKNKLFLLKNNEDIAVETFFLEDYYLYTCIVNSKQARIYKISIDYFQQLLQHEKECYQGLINRTKNKLLLFNERLFQINKIKLKMTDQKICTDKKEKEILDQKEDPELNKSTNSDKKCIFNYDRLIEIIDDNYNNSIKRHFRNKTETINLPSLINHKYISNEPFSQYENYIRFLNKNKKKHKSNDSSQNHSRLKIEKNSLDDNFYSNYGNTLESIAEYFNNRRKPKNKPFNAKERQLEKKILSNIKKDRLLLLKNDFSLSCDREKKINYKPINLRETFNKQTNFLIERLRKDLEFHDNKKTLDTAHNLFLQIMHQNNIKNNSNFISIEDNSMTGIYIKNNKNKLNKSSKLYPGINTNTNLFKGKSVDFKEKSINLINNDTKFKINSSIKLNKKINYPYYNSLALIKKEKYKIFSDKNFLNTKVRMENNIREINKIKGLNEFGYPIAENKGFQTKY